MEQTKSAITFYNWLMAELIDLEIDITQTQLEVSSESQLAEMYDKRDTLQEVRDKFLESYGVE